MFVRRLVAVGTVPVLACLLFQFAGCRKGEVGYRLAEGKKPSILLISIDTLRADRLGCYGFRDVETPVIDDLARRGVRFERCLAQTPLTLPSHTTLLTGTHPVFHGVKDNGGFLVPQELETLAEVLKSDGYATGAVVGAYVLDSKWGLNQGFDFYYDRFDISRKEGFSMADVQRRGDEVISRALEWLEARDREPFFLFVHLYDPHTPYDPPAPYREQYGQDLYLGEVAYTDSQLGRLMSFLDSQDMLRETVVIFTADHGESLGEHGESTHGFFVYQEGIHVPLIFTLPDARLQKKISGVVSGMDVMPTILDLAGVRVPQDVQGKSLVPLILGKEEAGSRWALSETYYPRFHYGWNEIQSIQDSRYKLILSPQRELYDLAADPEEAVDLTAKEPETARRLEKRMREALRDLGRSGHQTDYRKVDEETREKLASLGYLGTFVSTDKEAGRALPSPRDKIQVFNEISEAKELNLKGELQRAEKIMMDVIRREPEIIDAYFVLGNICFKQKKYEDSVRWLSGALERKPDYDFVVLNMAIAHIEMQDLDRAESLLADFVSRFPADSILYLTLGDINIKQEDYGEAIRYLQECLRLNPTSAAALNNLARVHLILDKQEEALAFALKAKELNPQLRNIHYNLAQVYQLQNRGAEAEAEYLAELENYPDNYNASFNLALLYRQQENRRGQETYLLRALELNPQFPLSHVFLGELYFQEGGRDQEAIGHLEKGIALGLDTQHLKLAYYLLAKIYLRRGNEALAARYAQKIKKLGSPP